MFGPSVIWSFRGPIDTIVRCSVVAIASISRCIRPTSMHPSDPSDRYTTFPVPGTCDATSKGASPVRTVDCSRCHVGPSGSFRV
jgi:hypothetical protein